MLNTKSPSLQKLYHPAYRIKDREVKKSAWNDKRAFVTGLAVEAGRAAPGQDKDSINLIAEREQTERWVQPFREVLNRPVLDDPADPPPAEDFNIIIGPPTEAEAKSASNA